MICVELAFTDDQQRLDARPAHRQRLVDLYARSALLAAGPWHDDSGALLVFTGDEAAVRAELAADPYYAVSGVRVVSVLTWTPVVGPPG